MSLVPIDMNDYLGALTAIEVLYPESFSERAWKVIRYMNGCMFLFFYKGKYVATDESLYLTEHGDGSAEAPYGAPRWTGDTLEDFEHWLEELADFYDKEGNIPGWEKEEVTTIEFNTPS